MDEKKLRNSLSTWGTIGLKAPKDNNIMKKGWIKRYEINDSFDEFDSFDLNIFTDKLKLRAELCVPGIAMARNNHALALKILLDCINKDLSDGFTVVE